MAFAPTTDPELLRLQAILQCPCSTCEEDATPGTLLVSLQRPEPASAAVLFVSEVVAGVPRAVAVIKERTTLEKAHVEHLNYLLSRELGFSVVAPCLPVVFSKSAGVVDRKDAMVYSFCLGAMEEYSRTIDNDPRSVWYGTVEACQRLLSHPPSQPHAWLRQLSALPLGCATLNQALELFWLPPTTIDANAAQSDSAGLQALLQAISQPAFEALALFCILTCQLDATAENLLLRAGEEGGLRLVLIDTTWSLPLAGDGLPFRLKDPDPANRYWFPAWACLPHALLPVSSLGRAFLEQLSPSCATACPEWSSIAGSCHLEERIDGIAHRLTNMRAALSADPQLTLRALGFAALPLLARDMEPFLAQEGISAEQLDRLNSSLRSAID